MKTKDKMVIFLVPLLLLSAIGYIIWDINVDDPKEREEKALEYFPKNKIVLEEYAKMFFKYGKIISITREKEKMRISYVDNQQRKSTPYNLNELHIKRAKGNYINLNQEFSSLNEALQLVNFNESKLKMWDLFLEKYNLFSITVPMDSHVVVFVLNRFAIIPHGFVYIPEGYQDEWQSYYSDIPGKFRGKKGSSSDIMTFLGGRWFYYEGP